MQRDIVGWRPTWPLGRLSSAAQEAKREDATKRNGPEGTGTRGTRRARAKPEDDPFAKAHDPFGFFDENGPAAGLGGRKGRGKGAFGASPEQNKALRTMGLQWPLTLADLKRRYKELAKRLHPDANGGDKTAEERLKLVNQAYATLKNSVSAT
ncbi:MAG TPA: J domain-containing protein [Alphaproteobacteria bacterium]